MAELADAPDLGSGTFGVGVQVPSSAPKRNYEALRFSVCRLVLLSFSSFFFVKKKEEKESSKEKEERKNFTKLY